MRNFQTSLSVESEDKSDEDATRRIMKSRSSTTRCGPIPVSEVGNKDLSDNEVDVLLQGLEQPYLQMGIPEAGSSSLATTARPLFIGNPEVVETRPCSSNEDGMVSKRFKTTISDSITETNCDVLLLIRGLEIQYCRH